MSEKEFSRLTVLLDVEARRLRVEDAMPLLGLQRRQVLRRRCHVRGFYLSTAWSDQLSDRGKSTI
jgi:hypothetical protein